jgi:hypothetical protein
VVECPCGENSELAGRSSNRPGSCANGAVAAGDEYARGSRLDRVLDVIVKLFRIDFTDIERARLLESSAGSFKIS